MQQSTRRVKIGNMLSPHFSDASQSMCRTDAQHRAVLAWHRDHPSAWWCINPFTEHDSGPGKKYHCTFTHAYFGDDGTLHHIRVTPTGIIKPVNKGSDEYDGHFKDETDKVIATYGAFRGSITPCRLLDGR